MKKALALGMVFGACTAIAGERSAPQLTIRFFDLSGVGASQMSDAREQVRRIFAAAGVSTGWDDRNPEDGEAGSIDFTTAARCPAPPNAETVVVRLAPRAPAGFTRGALAQALPCAKYGVRVTIFWDRVKEAVAGVPVGHGIALGHVMAHEIGHVLFRSVEHAAHGLMRASWRREEWLAVSRGTLLFTAQDAGQLGLQLQTSR